MTEYEATAVVIDRPVEEVWNFMVDISNMPKWEDSGAEWKRTSEGFVGLGATFHFSIHTLGRHVQGNLRIVDFEPNRKFAVEAIDGFGRGTKLTYLMEPVEDTKTRLRRVSDVRLHGLAKLLRPLQGLAVRRAGRIEAENVKHLLEGQHEYQPKDIVKG